MPNPNRPQYQDTIEETWGQAVADTVVRRYANTADRDADFAGRPGAELIGQVVAMTPPGGRAYLQEYVEGLGWTQMPIMYAGSAGVTTSSTGIWEVPGIPAGTVVVGATANGAQANTPMTMARDNWDIPDGQSRCLFQALWSTNATPPADTTIGASWVVVLRVP
ncbi:MAG TPA: hypothetical protein VHS03_00780 [Gaiellaceae bacterium]|jgi:hypothetical protein|nr:hypothetical protein [Gaiellaceae bacterium]